MTVAAILSLLVQLGVCSPTQFAAGEGTTLEVLVCPVMHDAAPAPQGGTDHDPAPLPGKSA